MSWKVVTTLDNDLVIEEEADSKLEAEEAAIEIINNGYQLESKDESTFFPVHRVKKVRTYRVR